MNKLIEMSQIVPNSIGSQTENILPEEEILAMLDSENIEGSESLAGFEEELLQTAVEQEGDVSDLMTEGEGVSTNADLINSGPKAAMQGELSKLESLQQNQNLLFLRFQEF